MAKKIFMIAPNFYGIDKSIKSVFESFGFEVVLKNTRNKLEPVEALSLKIAKAVPITSKALRPVVKGFLDKDNREYLSLIGESRPDVLFVIKGETISPNLVLGPPRPGRKICYAVDTRPNKVLYRLCQDVDLAFLDGMFLPEHHEEAEAKGHMTADDAARVAARAGARHAVLVHISPRSCFKLDIFCCTRAVHKSLCRRKGWSANLCKHN